MCVSEILSRFVVLNGTNCFMNTLLQLEYYAHYQLIKKD
jgi:hypothetical protein